MFSVADARSLEAELTALGNQVEVHVYPDVGHAFFNEDRPEVYDRESAELLWDRTVAFFRQQLS
jgi:carboxymethylenebutenolidase